MEEEWKVIIELSLNNGYSEEAIDDNINSTIT